MKLTLRARLAAASAMVFAVLCTGLGVVSYRVLRNSLLADLTDRVSQLTEGLHGYLQFSGDAVTVAFDETDDDEVAFVREATRFYQVYDVASGRLLAGSTTLASYSRPLVPAPVNESLVRPIACETPVGRVLVTASDRITPGGRRYLLLVGVPLESTDAALRRYRDLLLWGVPLAILLAVGASWWLSSFALAPLSRMAVVAGQIDVGTLDRRVPIRGVGDELDRVGLAFNESLQRLGHAVAEMRQFSAALAHELRTPLAALRGGIELAMRPSANDATRRDALASAIEEIDRLTRLIDQILTLARAESGQIHLAFAPVDLAALAADIVDQVEPLAEARGVRVTCERGQPVHVDGDAGWLGRLLLNLLGNAIKFTDAGGTIAVRVGADGTEARLEVQDTGIGLSDEDARRVFERFYRADPARSARADGAGLGLSLVQWIAAQHGGTTVVTSRLGECSTFAVTLPVARA